ncbi:DUF485 domain-containing protein [Arthrobacter mobilis]|uniref:DUF485 domain-containing protein n=1 Tax=Arthrobacter mobilis TaxID=2724944 RepID=A0A7X6K7P3_9MICC|nr:DUF485 domain-containing protein [Arthrobacter mobilis]NKX56639.1 DUF485 domain-containing protein [Arthrobacter mobilis]
MASNPTPDAGSAGSAASLGAVDFQEVQQRPRFRELRRRHRSFVFPMAAAFLLWYFLYVLLADYAHGFMSTRIAGNINIGLVFGLLQFVTTFVITMWYVSYANKKLDPVAAELRAELEGPAGTTSTTAETGGAK